MRRTIFSAALIAALTALPSTAGAKCVSIRLSEAAGGTNINAVIPVEPGGGEPVQGLRPKVHIRKGSEIHTFAAKPTGRAGVYRVNVTFPSPGRWRFSVDDGFDAMERGAGMTQRFEDVVVEPGETQLTELPRKGADECAEMMQAEMEPVELDSPEGQLPPATYGGKPPSSKKDGDGVSAMSLFVAGGALLLVLGGVGLRRRHGRGAM